jgi:hypothetical protein
MPYVKFTSALNRFFPSLKGGSFDGSTVAEIVAAVDKSYPGLSGYIVDERGALRKHVNIFVGSKMVNDRDTLSDALPKDAQVYIFQALSGG